jgi:hypothetical protein
MTQLRNLSNYGQDCINTDQTYFILQDTGVAEYVWASEWTHLTANNFPESMVMLIWHFKDGSKAYSQVIEQLGEAGGIAGYLLSGKSTDLKDVQGKSIQPMTRENYPVKIELCVGDFIESKGFKPDTLIDTACLNAQKIDVNHRYYFTQCESIAQPK